jgi:PilZ domain
MRRIPPRTIERQTCELECSIEATDSAPERRAMLRNLSQSGARLEGRELDGCPEAFDLRIVHESGAIERLFARVVWRQPASIGIRFEEPNTISPHRRLRSYSRAS